MKKIKHKKYQVRREITPAYTLNQIGKNAFKRAKEEKRYQALNIITAQLMCALTMEAALNHIGEKVFDNWEEKKMLSPKEKLREIIKHSDANINLGEGSFQLFHDIFQFRNSLVHAKSAISFSKKIPDDDIDEDGFPIVGNIPELKTDWEKNCNLDTAKKWRDAVCDMSSILSQATNCQDTIKEEGAINIWGEILQQDIMDGENQ